MVLTLNIWHKLKLKVKGVGENILRVDITHNKRGGFPVYFQTLGKYYGGCRDCPCNPRCMRDLIYRKVIIQDLCIALTENKVVIKYCREHGIDYRLLVMATSNPCSL